MGFFQNNVCEEDGGKEEEEDTIDNMNRSDRIRVHGGERLCDENDLKNHGKII